MLGQVGPFLITLNHDAQNHELKKTDNCNYAEREIFLLMTTTNALWADEYQKSRRLTLIGLVQKQII